MNLPKIEPGDRVEAIEITAEVKEKMLKNAYELIEWLKARYSKPSDACILLHVVGQSLGDHVGLKHIAFLDKPSIGEV